MDYPSLSLSRESIENAFAVKDKDTLRKQSSFKGKFSSGDVQKCEKCDYKTSLGNTLTYHIKSKHKEVPLFDCDICDYKGRRKSLKVHKESKHGSERYKCNICEYVSTRQEYLKYHIERLHGNLVFSCGLCNYKCNFMPIK